MGLFEAVGYGIGSVLGFFLFMFAWHVFLTMSFAAYYREKEKHDSRRIESKTRRIAKEVHCEEKE